MATLKARKATANKRLTALLRSPKTKSGLVAAVADLGFDEWFVQGWLSHQLQTKQVLRTHVHGEHEELFVVCSAPRDVAPVGSAFPAWLMPRAVPPFVDRCVYSLGVGASVPKEKQQEGLSNGTSERGRKAHR